MFYRYINKFLKKMFNFSFLKDAGTELFITKSFPPTAKTKKGTHGLCVPYVYLSPLVYFFAIFL